MPLSICCIHEVLLCLCNSVVLYEGPQGVIVHDPGPLARVSLSHCFIVCCTKSSWMKAHEVSLCLRCCALLCRDQEVFACMIQSLLDEYRFFPRYPEKELRVTAVLFGKTLSPCFQCVTATLYLFLLWLRAGVLTVSFGQNSFRSSPASLRISRLGPSVLVLFPLCTGSLVKHQLVSSFTLGIALRCVLDALRKPHDSKVSHKSPKGREWAWVYALHACMHQWTCLPKDTGA